MFIGEIEEIGIIEPIEVPRSLPDEAIEPAVAPPAEEPAAVPSLPDR
jgi:hypothetical protein